MKSSEKELASDLAFKLKAEIVAKRQLQKSGQQDMLPFAAAAQPVLD